jgi:hypothetical protein
MTFAELWEQLLPLGREENTGGYRRYSWTPADMACRAWFARTASELGMRTDCDRNGNLWAWWGEPGGSSRAIVTGSHLDSVPDGGAYDGPLGIVSAFAAIGALQAAGFGPARLHRGGGRPVRSRVPRQQAAHGGRGSRNSAAAAGRGRGQPGRGDARSRARPGPAWPG